MQKKVTGTKKNKKAPTKGASNLKNKKSTIFNYDLEIPDEKTQKKSKKPTQNKKAKKQQNKEDKFLEVNETPQINKKKLNKIKKQKKKEKQIKEKEIKKQEKLEEKQRKIRKKKVSIKDRKRREKAKKITGYIFLVLLIITGIILFLLSPIFNISKIEVNGNEQISSDEIISLSGVQKGSNLFSTSKKHVIDRVKENPYIDTVSITRKLPMTLSISVKERKVEFLLEFGSTYAYIDEKGFILEISSENIQDKKKIRGYETPEDQIKPGNRLCEEDLKKLDVIYTILDTSNNYSLQQYITSINISDNSNYVLYLESERKTVELGNTDNLDIKMLYLQSIIEKEKDKEGIVFLNVDFKNKNPYGRYN